MTPESFFQLCTEKEYPSETQQLFKKAIELAKKAFSEKKVHPMDLKAVLIKYLDQLIEPVRRHFQENVEAKKLLEQVKSFQVTR